MAVEKVDLRGLPCPQPVIAVKKLLDRSDIDQVEALVDDEISVSNLERLSRSQKVLCSVIKLAGHFCVKIAKEEFDGGAESLQSAESGSESSGKKAEAGTVVFLSSDQLGSGDSEFSKTLLNVFLQSLYEGGHRPQAILLANSGVKLMAPDSPALKVLQDFAAAGSDLLACGLCLEYYGLKEALRKEQITNMFAICEYLSSAGKIIQP